MYQIITGLLFYAFSIVTIVAAIMVISMRNPVHSVLSLIVSFFAASGLFILVGAEFIAMVLVIVYVGAVAVLFLFVIMMLDIDIVELRKGFLKHLPFVILVSLIIFVDLYLVIMQSVYNMQGVNNIAFPIPDLSQISNTHAIGKILYTNYFYPFQIAGLILFIAMISCIVLTLRYKHGIRKQNIMQQISRKRSDSIELVKIKLGTGIGGNDESGK
ncbi:NADH-quinone oxidoreductase subunit J [Rickettsiales bacterium Ac37b]|nr:NADH-quinone oxidoreductase subunit J [Rickettsiales bacterium Ac37b]